MEEEVSRCGKSIICSKKMMFKEKCLNTDKNYRLCNTNFEIPPSSAGSVCVSQHPESPNPAYHGEHEFQSISISKAGISWEYKSQVVTSRLSTALTGLLQPGLTDSSDTGGDVPALQSDISHLKSGGGIFPSRRFYKCTQDWMGWARGMGWTFKGPFQPQLFHGHQEAAALSVTGIPFLLFPCILWHHCSPHKAVVSIFCGINWIKTRIGLDVFKTRSIMNHAALIWEKSTLPAHVLHTWLICSPTAPEMKGKKKKESFIFHAWVALNEAMQGAVKILGCPT